MGDGRWDETLSVVSLRAADTADTPISFGGDDIRSLEALVLNKEALSPNVVDAASESISGMVIRLVG